MKRIVRWILIPLLLLGLLAGGLHYWLVSHAEELLSEAVNRESNGQVILELEKITYNYRTRQLRIRKANLYNKPTDSLKAYYFRIPEIKLTITSLRQLIFQRKLGIESLYIPSPEIEVTRNKKNSKRKAISLSTEMGRVYNAIRQALQKLQIRQMELVNGKFILKDETREPASETRITDIYFRIDNLNISDSTSSSKDTQPFFAENLQFRTRNQQIVLPGSNQKVGFSHFSINMKEQLIQIDSFFIESLSPASDKSQLKASFDSVRLIRIDFNKLYNDQIISADSVYCSSPDLQLDLVNNANNGKKKFSLKDLLTDIGTDMDLRYVGLRNASLRLRGGKENKEITFKGDNRLIEMNGLRISPDNENPLSVDKFVLQANNYESYSPDSLYLIKLSSIGLENQLLRLENVTVTTHLLKEGQPYRNHHIPLLTLSGIDWQALLFDRKIVADEVHLTNPEVFYRKKTAGKSKKLRVYDAFDAINDLVTVKDIRVSNGRFQFDLQKENKLEFSGVNGMVHGKALLLSSNSREMEQSIDHLTISNSMLRSPKWMIHLRNAAFNGNTATLSGETLTLNDPRNHLIVRAKNFSVSSFTPSDSLDLFEVGKIQWASADIRYSAAANTNNTSNNPRKPIGLKIGEIVGQRTLVHLELPHQTNAGVMLRSIQFQNLNLGDENLFKSHLPLMSLEGDSLYFNQPSLQFHAGRFSFSGEEKLVVSSPQLFIRKPGLSMQASMESMESNVRKQDLTGDLLKIPLLNFFAPKITIQLDSTVAPVENTSSAAVKKTFAIGEINWINPSIHLTRQTSKGNVEIHPQLSGDEKKWRFRELNFDGQKALLTLASATLADSIHIHLAGKQEPSFKLFLETRLENIAVPLDNKNDPHITIADLKIPSLAIPGANELALKGISVAHTGMGKELKNSTLREILRIPGWEISAETGIWSNGREQLNWAGTNYNSEIKSLSVDSFHFSPTISQDSFFQQRVFQTDYITAQGGKLSFSHLLQNKDSVWTADTLRINNLHLRAYRDKRHPFQHGTYKKMPTQMLEEAGIPLRLEQLIAENTHIEYGEWNDKTDKEGRVLLNLKQARLYPVTTLPRKGDSLFLIANGHFMNEIPFQINIDQPYLDSLQNMRIYLLAGPASLQGLNSMLPALASVHIKSGRFSQLKMEVDADKNNASGEMLIRYQNLHLRLLKKGNMEKKGFFPSIATFLADHLLIKHSNQYRKAVFVHERNTEKSVFNYLVKIIVKGLGTSTGILKNKKRKK